MPKADDDPNTTTPLTAADLDITINDEPRINHLRLAKALGYAEAHKLAHLIERHRETLERFGEIPSTMDGIRQGRGRRAKLLWLSKKQAIYIATKAETERATEITIQIVEVFDAVTSGKALPPPPPPVPALTKADLDAIDQRARHAAGLEENRVRRALTDAALDALRQGRPVDAAVRTTRVKRSAPLALPPPEPPAAQSDRDLTRATRPLALTARLLALPTETLKTFERVLELLVEINRVLSDLWDATGEADLRKPIGDMLMAKADQWRAGNPTFTTH